MNSTTTNNTIEVLKGTTQKIQLEPWESNGRKYVSIGLLFLDSESREYRRRKGGFAVTPKEARELAAALLKMADTVESG